MKEAVRLAIGGPPSIGARAAAVLTELMASSGVQSARTGSVVLEWPNAALPFDAAAWSASAPTSADPLAAAFARLHAPAGDGWDAPVDAVRATVADWLRAERLRLTPPWPDGATCAIALVHDAQPLPSRPGRLRGVLRRERTTGLEPYAAIAAVERDHRAVSALRSIDLLDPAEQTRTRALGFALDTPAGVHIAGLPGFRRGTAFPTRGYDRAAERADDHVELPLLGDDPAAWLGPLLDGGGGAALAIPVGRFAGDDAEGAIAAYDDLLGRLRSRGAWLTTPAALVRALYA